MAKKIVKRKTSKKTENASDKSGKSYKLYRHPRYGMVYGEPVKLPPTRVAWPYLVEPKEGGTDDEGTVFADRYEIVALYPKKDKAFAATCEQISDMTEAMIELFNKGKRTKVKGFEIGTDGDEFDAEKYPYYKGSTLLTLRNANQPLCVGTKKDKSGKPVKIDPADIKGGCICAMVVTPIFTANGGLSFKLNIVQLVEDDGTRFGGSINPAVYSDLLDFDGVVEEEEEEEEVDEDEEEVAESAEDESEDDDDAEEDEEEEEEEDDDDDDEDDEDGDDSDDSDDDDDDGDDADDDSDDDDDDDEDEEEDESDTDSKEQPKRGRGRPATRKKAVDVL